MGWPSYSWPYYDAYYPYTYYTQPDYVPPVVVGSDTPQPGNWYQCDNPVGYYPYVTSCNNAWAPVAVTPSPNLPYAGVASGP